MTRSQIYCRISANALLAFSLCVPAPAMADTTAPVGAGPATHSVPFLTRQLSPPPAAARRSPASDPEGHVGAANIAARIEPADAGFENAIQRYAFSEGALFQVYAKPGRVTDIALQPGEVLVGPGPVAAGDTVRWLIGDTISGTGGEARVHILIKPTRPDIATNLVINTDRRTYHIELRATPRTYMASVSWTYPADELIALKRAEERAAQAAPVAAELALESLNFDYLLSGGKPAWRPLRVFDDGQRTLIEFPPTIAQGEMPPVFVIGNEGEAELVNYRVSGRHIIVERLFEKAELRLGAGRKQQRITVINRAGVRP
mgnify:CR=1 FL=1